MKDSVVKLLEKNIPLKKQEIEKIIEIPPNSQLGDYAFPCFVLAEKLKKAPNQIAQEIKNKIKPTKDIEKISVVGPYLNFFINKQIFSEKIISEILKKKENYGKGKEKGKVALEHTSINPNASPHVGRARNSIIGDSIKRILEFQGFNVKTYYYVNDVSKQIAMMALEFKGKENFSDLLELYVRVNNKVKNNPELEKKVLNLLEKFELGDKNTIKKFRKIVDIAVKGQIKILKEFGITFDIFDYESKYLKQTNKILNELKKTKRIFKDEHGRLVLNQEGFGLEKKMKSPVLVLTRSNGTGLYPLRDIAYTIDKLKRCKKTFIVLGEDQKLYFEQISTALKILKKPSPQVIHYSFVLIKDKEKIGKMSTRRGDVVLLEHFMKQAKDKAEKEIKKRKTKGDPKKIGYAAIKYSFLKNDPNKSIMFDWNQALNFEGNTGPYLQYSYARASSILRKIRSIKKIKKTKQMKIKDKINLSEQELKLIKKLSQFPEIIATAYKNLNPAIIANYSYQLAQIFNEFYHACPVINSKNEAFRINLVKSFRYVLKNSLNLLGIDAIEKM